MTGRGMTEPGLQADSTRIWCQLRLYDRQWFRPLEFYTEELRKSGFATTSPPNGTSQQKQVPGKQLVAQAFMRPLLMLLVAQLWVSNHWPGGS